jgi:hypothetical protein
LGCLSADAELDAVVLHGDVDLLLQDIDALLVGGADAGAVASAFGAAREELDLFVLGGAARAHQHRDFHANAIEGGHTNIELGQRPVLADGDLVRLGSLGTVVARGSRRS